MKVIAFIDDYKIVRKILDYLGIDEFKKRDRPSPKTLAVADSFDDYGRNDYIDCDYERFLKRDKFLLNKALPKTDRCNHSFT